MSTWMSWSSRFILHLLDWRGISLSHFRYVLIATVLVGHTFPLKVYGAVLVRGRSLFRFWINSRPYLYSNTEAHKSSMEQVLQVLFMNVLVFWKIIRLYLASLSCVDLICTGKIMQGTTKAYWAHFNFTLFVITLTCCVWVCITT